MRVLLIEDEKELARALAKMLTKDDYDVDCVHDGADGLNFASSGMYDLILLDVIMPKMNGFVTFQRMKEFVGEIPVIFLTASGLEDDVLSAIKLGAVNYLKKPFQPQELQRRVAQELEKQ